jgi:type III restriction enzyme
MTDASSFEVPEPILSSPFEEPPEHWWIEEGKLPDRRPGRRPAGYFYRDPLAAPADGDAITRGEWTNLDMVNQIRLRLGDWRAQGYAGASRTTRELIDYWQRDGRQWPLFFAQIEAVETVLFLREGRSDLLQGITVPREDGGDFLRYACKMATGSGKTIVMGMLCAWSILNKVVSRGDGGYSDVVLVICPNVTIRNRLRELAQTRGMGRSTAHETWCQRT